MNSNKKIFGKNIIENCNYEKYFGRENLLYELKYNLEELENINISKKYKDYLYDDIKSTLDFLKDCIDDVNLLDVDLFPQYEENKSKLFYPIDYNDDLIYDYNSKENTDYNLGRNVFMFPKIVYHMINDESIDTIQSNDLKYNTENSINRFTWLTELNRKDRSNYLNFCKETNISFKPVINSNSCYFIKDFNNYDEILDLIRSLRKYEIPLWSHCNFGINWSMSLWKYTRYIRSDMREKNIKETKKYIRKRKVSS